MTRLSSLIVIWFAVESTHLYKYLAIAIGLQPFMFVILGMALKVIFISSKIANTWQFRVPRKRFVIMIFSLLTLVTYPIIQGALFGTLTPASGAIWINYWLTFFAAFILFTGEHNRLGTFIKTFILVTLIGVIVGYLQGDWFQQMTTVIDVRMYEKGRALGFYGQPNTLGINAFLCVLLVFISTKSKQLGSVNAGWLASFLISVILLSGSRIAIAMMFLCGFIIFKLYGGFIRGRLQGKGVMAVIFSSCVLFVAIIFINYQSSSIDASSGSGDNILARIDYLWLVLTGGIDDVFADRSIFLRSTAFSEYMSLIIQKPIIGWGLGSESLMRETAQITIHSHSSILSIFLEFGLLGTLTLAFLMIIFARKLSALKSISYMDYVILLSSICLLLITTSVFTFNLFFVMVGVVMSIGVVDLAYYRNR